MGRRGTEKRAMRREVLVRLDETLAVELDKIASDAGRTRAAIVRDLMRDRLSLIDRRDQTQVCAALATVGTHVGRLTGSLVQAAKAVRESRAAPSLHAEIESILQDGRSTLALIHDLLAEIKK